MKFNILAAILLVLGFNTNVKALGGSSDGTNQGGGSNSCHGDFVSSEFNQK